MALGWERPTLKFPNCVEPILSCFSSESLVDYAVWRALVRARCFRNVSLDYLGVALDGVSGQPLQFWKSPLAGVYQLTRLQIWIPRELPASTWR